MDNPAWRLIVAVYFAFLRVVAIPFTYSVSVDVDLLFVLTFHRSHQLCATQ